MPGRAELLRHQEQLQREARKVLADLRLAERLHRLGRVELVGSYVSGLMVWRDLDVMVACHDPPRAEVLETLLPILADPGVHAFTYQAELEPFEPPRQRYYVVIRYREWKLDLSLWRHGATHPAAVTFPPLELAGQLTEETRAAILEIKDVWHTRATYPEVVSAVEIYDAVLHHGVRTPEAFAGYLGARQLPAD